MYLMASPQPFCPLQQPVTFFFLLIQIFRCGQPQFIR